MNKHTIVISLLILLSFLLLVRTIVYLTLDTNFINYNNIILSKQNNKYLDLFLFIIANINLCVALLIFYFKGFKIPSYIYNSCITAPIGIFVNFHIFFYTLHRFLKHT